MVGYGAVLVVFGIGSLLLPMFNIQFSFMSLVDDYQPLAGIAVTLLGAVLVVMGMGRQGTQPAPVTQEPAVSQEPPTA